ncbi:MAG: lipoyl domain-containing protein [Planctomycetia bacterium]|jgi:2-oxoisovalerate dehydrogenase E2 component (dihydrolipoyl transacylase)
MNKPHDAQTREERPAAPVRRGRLVVPDLGLGTAPLAISLWLVAEGDRVAAGDRVVEIVAGAATIDLEAPLDGRLVAILRDEDDPVAPGEVLAEFEGVS